MEKIRKMQQQGLVSANAATAGDKRKAEDEDEKKSTSPEAREDCAESLPAAGTESAAAGAPPKKSRLSANKEEKRTGDPAAEYLRQVQELESVDKLTDSTGGKWLVR